MHVTDDLKVFLHGLPPDCQESTLKDFLEAVGGFQGGVTEVSVPPRKTFAFVTVLHTDVARCLLRRKLLYCDDFGNFYNLKACPYVKKPRSKKMSDCNPKKELTCRSTPEKKQVTDQKPSKYTPPTHVCQFTPDFSILSFPKPRKKKRRRADFAFLCGAVGSTSSKKGPGSKKRKKKKASKLECHKSESFQFGLLHPARKCTFPDVEDTSDSVLEASQVVHGTKNEVSQVEEQSSAFKVPQENHPDDMSLSPKGAKIHVQVIIDHTYLGPLCLQFSTYPSVADLKNELMERTGLPVRDQCLYLNGKKLLGSQDTRLLFEDNLESLTLMLSIGSLKGGVPPKEEAASGKQGSVPPDSQEVLPKGDAAEGEERSVPTDSNEVPSPMDTWDVEETAAWLGQIGLQKKYIDVCQKEHVNGRALLLLSSKEQLVALLKLKMGPESKLLKNLQPHLKVFKFYKPQAAGNSAKTFDEWTAEELCSWLKELGIPEDGVKVIEEEEIDGADLTSLIKEERLKEKLQLKAGLWVVLEHEVFLRSGKASSSISEDDTKETDSSSNPPEESKQPLPAIDPSEKSTFEVSKDVTLTMEEKRLLLLQKHFGMDVQVSTGSENTKECVVRSVFVKRGGGANELESLLNFIVVTKDELPKDKLKKLWARIREKTADWLKLLPESHLRLFKQNEGFESFVHLPTKTEMSLRDGVVNQIFLSTLKDDEYERNLLVVLVGKQLLEDKKSSTYKFSFDKKGKCFYDINVKKSKYHASFNPNIGNQDLNWSKHFRSLRNNVDDSAMNLLDLPLSEEKSSPARDELRPQTPRPFNAECAGSYYHEGCFLDAWESGPKDLIRPAHEFKIHRTAGEISEGTLFNKFLFETLKFACGCLNKRTNGTIHFGVADEKEDQACGHQPREIVGCLVNEEPRYSEKLTEFIDKCFVGDSRSNVKNCVRPPVFIPVLGEAGKQHSAKVVIEVDIEPRYSLCFGEIFKADFKCLGKGNGKGAVAFIRDGSQTRAIVEVQDMEDHMKNLSGLDEDRKKREELNLGSGLGERGSLGQKHLHDKLRMLLCANKNVLDSSVYPILVLSKPENKLNQEFLSKTLSFVQHINWQVVIDFDDEASDCNGVCSVFKSGPAQCDIHEAEDYNGDEDLIQSIDIRTHWIFGNGYVKLDKEALGFIQWNNSRRKRGLSLVIQSVTEKIPPARAVVLFLLFSKDYLAMADIFKDFCTNLEGPNQLVYVAENAEIVQNWEKNLASTCLQEHKLRERGVIGMSWREFQECMQQMVKGIDQQQRYVTMFSGSTYPLDNVCFSNIEIISATECDELLELSPKERLEMSAKVEVDFYRGYTVTWKNFWFTDNQRNHVLRRANYELLETLIEKLHSRGLEAKVHTVTIHHQIGAGATTMARQALWDFRHNAKFPFRCAVVTKIDNSTCRELLRLANVGYDDDSKFSLRPPVLALVEDTDDFLFREFLTQVREHANKRPRSESPFCVLLYCKEAQKPFECHLNERETSVYLLQHLSKEEVEWFKDKYTEMKGKYPHKDPKHDFETYANDNLISFMIMKENFNPDYSSSVVERNLSQVTNDEWTLLKYASLLNLYNPYPVFASCFDTIMLSFSLFRRRRIYRNWVEDLTHSARIFLHEVDCSAHLGTGIAIAIVHPVIASKLLDKIAEKEQKAISQLVLDFLESPLVESQGKSFTSAYLYDGANLMLKRRKKIDHGDGEKKTNFSPLIEKILYAKDTEDDEKVPTEESINQAADVLRVGLEKFNDPMLAQQLSRLFYINAESFPDSTTDSCFAKAVEYCEMAIKMSPNNSFLIDTMGRIYEKKLKMLFDRTRKENLIVEIEDVAHGLPLAFDAIRWFRKSFEASSDFQNNCGVYGELSVMFYLLDVLRCTKIFRGQEGLKKLQQYLAYCQVIPVEVAEPLKEFHERMKDLRSRYSQCMEALTEDFAVFKGNRLEEKDVPREISRYKAKYYSYFGGDIEWNTEIPEERWHLRWCQINQHLAGGIFSTVFSFLWLKGKGSKTVEEIKELAYLNYKDAVQEYYDDLLLIVATSMALHSPHRRNSNAEVPEPVQEYREVYKVVEKLFTMEQGDERHKRSYAHLLKVMFLWPREDLELDNYRVQDFYDSLQKLKDRWERKCKERYDVDKTRKEKVYKNMSFKPQTRQYTTLFYLGKGSGLDVFVHLNELTERENLDWENPQIKGRLKRLKGMVESKNVIRVQNPLDGKRSIEIYYSSFREGGFSKEEVSFYLGFSWADLIAVDLKYTKKDPGRQAVRLGDLQLDNPVKLPRYDGAETYDEYTSKLAKLRKKLQGIETLKKRQDEGQELEKNQKMKLQREKEIIEEIRKLQESFDILSAQEEDIF